MDVAALQAALIDNVRTWVQIRADVSRRPYGFFVRDPAHPLVYDSNLAWIDSAPEGGPEQVLDDLEAEFGTEVPHRVVWFGDADLAYAYQDAFVAARCQAQAELVMAKVGLPSCIVNPDVAIREVGWGAPESDLQLVRTTLHRESGYPEEVSRQVDDVERIRRHTLGQRAFVGYVRDEPAATYTLWPRGIFGHIDRVGTRPAFRMQGVGRTMIFHACTTATTARCEYVLLTTDRFDTPQAMYKTLGFEPVGELRGFLRPNQ